jgi:hypothetical protein
VNWYQRTAGRAGLACVAVRGAVDVAVDTASALRAVDHTCAWPAALVLLDSGSWTPAADPAAMLSVCRGRCPAIFVSMRISC